MSGALTWLKSSPADSVASALVPLPKGFDLGGGVTTQEPILAGHKVALIDHAIGEDVLKLGQSIGRATQTIRAGEHVHSHNLGFAGQADRSKIGGLINKMPAAPAQFQGYVREDGQVGTRNFIGVLTTVNCSASVARKVAAYFTPERLADYPNIDGVVAFSHMSGCGMARSGQGIDNLRRTIGGYARHPNFAAVLVIGLGCEVNQINPLLKSQELETSDRLVTLSIQSEGGTRDSIAAGIAEVSSMLARANQVTRQTVSAAHLTLGLQCGASDGYSALTANPALGLAADRLVAAGGRVVLSETPEIYGAENLLLARAASTQIGEELIAKLKWWEDYAATNGANLDNNPSPGNIAGGLTTILEKSLGAVAKAGSSPLNAVIDYAAPIAQAGLTFMDTPGYDPCSATGQIAGGANLIAFTTGRGSVFGSKPAPTIKLASNSDLAARMSDDIDLDCGRLLSGEVTLVQLGDEIFDFLLATASGHQTRSEENDLGEDEFVPWVPGASM
jgi:altronate hydrolase